MKYLFSQLLAFLLWAGPSVAHAAPGHPHFVHHPAGHHVHVRHYTRKARRHTKVRHVRIRHRTRKAQANKAARRLHHKKHKKVGHG